MFRVSALSVSYVVGGVVKPVVKDASFDVEAGTMVGLVGESGSGKSATVHAAVALPRSVEAIVTGTSELDGIDLLAAKRKDLRRLHGGTIGFVGQNPFGCLHPILPIHRQFHYILKTHGRTKSRPDSRDQARQALEGVGIRQADRVLAGYAHELSGGMAQRVVIAMATILGPTLLVADEPTTALDPTVQIQILDLLQKLQIERGMSVLVVTHDLGVVAQYCRRAVVMKGGEIVEQGRVTDLFDSPQHAYTRELFADDTAPTQGALR